MSLDQVLYFIYVMNWDYTILMFTQRFEKGLLGLYRDIMHILFCHYSPLHYRQAKCINIWSIKLSPYNLCSRWNIIWVNHSLFYKCFLTICCGNVVSMWLNLLSSLSDYVFHLTLDLKQNKKLFHFSLMAIRKEY